MANDIVRAAELGSEFDIGNDEPGQITLRLGKHLEKRDEAGNDVVDFRQHSNFDICHWKRPLAANINVANNNDQNIILNFTDAMKNALSDVSADSAFMSTAVSGQTVIKTPWRGVKERLTIRISMELTQGGTDFYRLQLKRANNDSIVTTYQISINSNDIADDIITTEISTYVGGDTDPFVVDGFYIDLRNTSGGTVRIHDEIGILLVRQYQEPLLD